MTKKAVVIVCVCGLLVAVISGCGGPKSEIRSLYKRYVGDHEYRHMRIVQWSADKYAVEAELLGWHSPSSGWVWMRTIYEREYGEWKRTGTYNCPQCD